MTLDWNAGTLLLGLTDDTELPGFLYRILPLSCSIKLAFYAMPVFLAPHSDELNVSPVNYGPSEILSRFKFDLIRFFWFPNEKPQFVFVHFFIDLDTYFILFIIKNRDGNKYLFFLNTHVLFKFVFL